MAKGRRSEMKQLCLAIAAGSRAFSAGTASAQSGPGGTHNIATPDEIAWSAGPTSLPAGTQGALLYGDPTKEGPFLLRLKMPAGYKIPPHSHPRPEIVTVISGAFHVGMGETADAAKARRLPAGSYFAFRSEEQTSELQPLMLISYAV